MIRRRLEDPDGSPSKEPPERDRLRRRYLSLGLGELAAAAAFVAIGILVVAPSLQPADRPVWWMALTPLLMIIVSAGCYWLLARSWVGLHPMPGWLAGLLRVIRVAAAIALIGATAAVLWLTSGWSRIGLLGVCVFGTLEFLNYFVVRLAYPPARWPSRVRQWRRPRLMIDVDAARRRP